MNQPSQDLVKASVTATETEIYQSPQWQQAVLLSKCDFVPFHCKDKPWNVMFVLEVAKDLGIRETFALQNLFMTPDGKLGMEAVVARAILLSKGYEIHYHESTATKAVVEVVRPGAKKGDTTGAFKSTWDIPRADKISFKNKKGQWQTLSQKFNWKMYPTQMLRHRALMEAAREVAADDLGGVISRDEAEDSYDNQDDILASTEKAAEDQVAIDPEIISVEAQQTIMDAAHKAGSSVEHAQAAMLDIQKWVKQQPNRFQIEVIEGCKRTLQELHVQYIEKKDAKLKTKEAKRYQRAAQPAAPPPPEEAEPPASPTDTALLTQENGEPPGSPGHLADDAEESPPWGDELTEEEKAEILK